MLGLPAEEVRRLGVMTTKMMDENGWCQIEAQWEDTARAEEVEVQEPDITTARRTRSSSRPQCGGADEVKALPVRRHGACTQRHRTWETAVCYTPPWAPVITWAPVNTWGYIASGHVKPGRVRLCPNDRPPRDERPTVVAPYSD